MPAIRLRFPGRQEYARVHVKHSAFAGNYGASVVMRRCRSMKFNGWFSRFIYLSSHLRRNRFMVIASAYQSVFHLFLCIPVCKQASMVRAFLPFKLVSAIVAVVHFLPFKIAPNSALNFHSASLRRTRLRRAELALR
jgi:hypothetical protein